MSNGITQVYPDNAHTLVTQEVSYEAESDRDFDLSAQIQFVHGGHATMLDFSAFVLVSEDLSDLEYERKRVADEIAAVNNLLEAVEKFHGDFLGNASHALDRLANLQASKQS